MKKVLIITYYWPPSGGAGVQRWLKFSKYLPEFGWQPVIYTPENPEIPAVDESLLKDVNSSTVVLKRPIMEPFGLYKRLTGKGKDAKLGSGFIREEKGVSLLENISVFVRGNFFIPDTRMLWIRPSVNFLLKYIKENGIDVIISTGPPHSMHMIALGLKKRLGIKWIADFRDPWTNIDYYKDLKLTAFSDRKHKRLEKEVLVNADTVISVGPTLSNELELLGAGKVVTITNGFDTEDMSDEMLVRDKKFSIVHIGSVNKDRNHEVFWSAIAELQSEHPSLKDDLEIRFVGKVDVSVFDRIKKYGLENNFVHVPYIRHDEVFSAMKKANVLYLPVNNAPNAKGILTGKFFEYMAARRPVLAVGLPDSDIGSIIRELKLGNIFNFADKQGIKEYIASLFLKFRNNQDVIVKADVSRYSRKNLTKRLCEVLEDITK